MYPFLLLVLLLTSCQSKKNSEPPKVRQEEIYRQEERDVEREIAEIEKKPTLIR